MIPNKKFEDVIKCFYFYQTRFDPESRLILAGDHRGMERYWAGLQWLVGDLGLRDVYFTGHIRFAELVAYYNLADVYLSMSEHEGFGVPLLEAFHLGLPVVAYAAGAVEETMNGGGILIREKDLFRTAGLLDVLRQDPQRRQAVIEAQRAALKRYERDNIVRILKEHIERVGQA